MTMTQAGLLGVAGALLALWFHNEKKEYSICIGLAVSLLLFFCMLDKLEILMETVKKITGYIHIEGSYLKTLAKIIGVTYIAEFTAAICKDSGYSTMASQIEVFGKLTILVLSLPVMQALLQTIETFLA